MFFKWGLSNFLYEFKKMTDLKNLFVVVLKWLTSASFVFLLLIVHDLVVTICCRSKKDEIHFDLYSSYYSSGCCLGLEGWIKVLRLVSSQKFLIWSEGRAIDERCPVFLPFVEPFLQVDFFVSTEVWPIAVGFPTLHTLVELLSSMDPLVFSEERILAEGLSTLITLIGLLSSMDPLMSIKVGFTAKGFPAFFTCVQLLPSMDLAMLIEGWILVEGLPTFIALIWFLSSMNSLMFNKGGDTCKGSPTL